jgi:hypothetical protein
MFLVTSTFGFGRQGGIEMNAPIKIFGRRGGSSRSGAVAVVLLLATCLMTAAPLLAAQTSGSEGALKQSLEAEFRVIPLRDGVLLEPRESIPDVAAIEVTEGSIAVDGEALDGAQVRSRLGARRGELLRQLAALSDEERRALLFGDSGRTAVAGEETTETSEAATGAESLPETLKTPKTPKTPKPPKPPRIHADEKVVLGNALHVKADESVQDVVVMGGALTVDGIVHGDAVVIGGPGTVNGEVTGDFVVVGGPARLGPDAHIHGDVSSVGGPLIRSETAVVGGQVSETQLPLGGKWWSGWARDWAHQNTRAIRVMSPFRRIARVFYTVTRYLLIVLLAMLLLLVARRPMERTAARVTREPWKAGVVGLLAEVLLLPITLLVVVLLAISIIGIPLLILIPFALLALAVGAFFGYCATAWALGRWLRERLGWNIRDAYLQLLIGFAGLAVLTVTGRLLHVGPLTPLAILLVIVGAVLNYLAWTAGFGAVLMSRFGTVGPDTFPPDGSASREDEREPEPTTPSAGDLPLHDPSMGGTGEVDADASSSGDSAGDDRY